MGAGSRLRLSEGKMGPTVTDNGNFIVDADFGRIRNVQGLERMVKAIPGVVEVGLFPGMVTRLIVGSKAGTFIRCRA